MIREHSFDGIFYPKDYDSLIGQIKKLFDLVYSSSEYSQLLRMVEGYVHNKKILSFIVPHGSYKYSGRASAFAYALINDIDCSNFIILSSDHRGTSPGISVTDDEYWSTPLGKVKINNSMTNELIKKSTKEFIQLDSFSFKIDHIIETQIPFIQFLQKENLRFLPIIQKNQDKETSMRLGKLLSSIIPQDEKVILISTSNLTHYLTQEECCRVDNQVLREALGMNIDSFYQKAEEYFHIICGYGCIASTIEFSKMVGNSDAILLKHMTSGDSDGNKSSVVGYASMVMV
ncbi:MAG TPA: AmmeMemoRadiSam system protein B [Candidatus Nitrosocosmicus sp.]|nr:AmmeMemoRadiSam system protein B [Candidatus Nitrosocosmicus sp.]